MLLAVSDEVQLALVAAIVPGLAAIGAIIASVLVWLKVDEADRKAIVREMLAEDERKAAKTVVEEIHTAVNSTASVLAETAKEQAARNIALEKQVEKLVGKLVAMEQGANPSEARAKMIKETTAPVLKKSSVDSEEVAGLKSKAEVAATAMGDIAAEAEVIKDTLEVIEDKADVIIDLDKESKAAQSE